MNNTNEIRNLAVSQRIAGLSPEKRALLEQKLKAGQAGMSNGISRSTRDTPRPASFSQQRLWFLDRLQNGSSEYHMPAAWRFRGSLNLKALEQSVNAIVERHEILRTHFNETEVGLFQVIAPFQARPLPCADVIGLGGEARAAAVALAIQQELAAPFDLSRGPLWRIKLLRLGEQEHVLLWNFHHIISDGWSVAVFKRELTTLYHAFATGRENPLKPLAIQFSDYAVWQQQRLDAGALERLVKHWLAKLKGAAPLLALPTDRPRTAHLGHRGKGEILELSPDLSATISALCRQEGVTLFMGLLAAFKALLARHSGQEDIILGTPVAGRDRTELEGMIGYFVNTVVLRTDLAGNPSFIELLQRVRTTVLAALEHQELPFEKLIEELHLERDLSHSPVFQVLFNMQNLGETSAALFGLEAEPVALPEPEAKFDLTLYAMEVGGRIHFHAVYNAGLFDGETVRRLLAHLQLLLEQVVRNPAAGIYGHSLVETPDRAILPDPTIPLPARPAGAIHDGFAAQAARVPGRVAVVDAAGEWTYAELEVTSGRLANYLRRQGLQKGGVVAVYATPSAELVWCLLAILKAGGTFLILDCAYPAERLRRCLAKAKPAILLCLQAAGALPAELEEFATGGQGRGWRQIPAGKAPTGEGFLRAESAAAADTPVAGSDLAYVVFTSGSTGEPLGILGTHAPVSHFLRWHIDEFGLGENDRFSLLSGIAHDILLRDIFTPLWLGASLHIPPTGMREAPGGLTGWLRRENISVCHMTPALTELFGEPADENRNALAHLRWVFLGGDRLTFAAVRKLQHWHSPVGVVNFYGTSETPQAMSFQLASAPGEQDNLRSGDVSLGTGIEGVQLLLLNPGGQMAGIGELAEICVRTPYLSERYLEEEGLTRARFQNNPFTSGSGDRIYRTGDLGRYLNDGRVAFAGRKDTQVKIRGFRIELSEIETALRQCPGVLNCVVTASGEGAATRLVAYVVVVARQPGGGRLAEWNFLKERLPAHMVPSRFVAIPSLPLTPNGKVDRKSLERLEGGELAAEGSYVAPRNQLEQELVLIWQTLLHRERVGVRDNFFHLGGHSLMATRLMTKVEALAGRQLPIAALFQSPTVESLAGRLINENWAPAWSSLVPLQSSGSKPPLFFVHGWGGDVFGFIGLVRLLPSDRPSFGIQAVGLDGKTPRHRSVEEMAAHYAQEIISFQPQGPILLAGYSMGGVIAFAVAQQLHRLGRRVAFLGLLDTVPNSKAPWTAYSLAMAGYLAERLWLHLKQWRQLPLRERGDYARKRWAALCHWLRCRMGQKGSEPRSATVPSHQTGGPLPRSLSTDYYSTVARNYVLSPYPWAVDVFVNFRGNPWPKWYWRSLARGGVRFHRLLTNHLQILTSEEHLPNLAMQLTSALERRLETDDR